MRFSDQYVWNFLFTLFFLAFVVWGGFILGPHASAIKSMTMMEFIILSLATLRLTRLFVYDRITAFFREQFWDVALGEDAFALQKPERGPRRTLADLLSCPWCLGIWAGATVVFFYYATPFAWYPILFLAIAGAGTMLQLLANMIGWRAEHLKQKVER